MKSKEFNPKDWNEDINKVSPISEDLEIIKEAIMPNFPDSLFPKLPQFLQKVIKDSSSNEERDILLLGTLTCISSCLPTVYGEYDSRKLYSNLYLFITAKASAGKGRLVHCKKIIDPIHKRMRKQAKESRRSYEEQIREYNSRKGIKIPEDRPEHPKERMLIIPANNSSTGVFQLLSDNDGKGIIFETEGDTLSQAFKSDYGNYSDGFRKAFHHETISYYRRTDRENVEIETPCLSAVLSGTPNQISSLIPNAENGLFSRFIFYEMNIRREWKDVFAKNTGAGLDGYYDDLGSEFLALYVGLLERPEIRFEFSADQKLEFGKFFSDSQQKYGAIQGDDFLATIRRFGVVVFRISMVLSALRILETGSEESIIVCKDDDFQTSMAMIKVLIIHASKLYSELPNHTVGKKQKNLKESFFENLPSEFSRQQYLKVAKELGIPDKTSQGYIQKFVDSCLIHRPKQDHYLKKRS